MTTKAVVALIVGFVVAAPAISKAQALSTATLSSSVPAAVSEFRAGLAEQANFAGASAAAHFKAAIESDPGFGLARVLYAFWTPELNLAQRSTELDRGVADAAKANTNELVLATAFREMSKGAAPRAQALFRAAAELIPEDPFVASATLAFFPPADPQAVLSTVRGLVARFPNYGALYNTLAYTLWTTGDHDGAVEAAKKQLALTPNDPNSHDTYAELLQWQGNFADAAMEYNRATSIDTKFTESYIGAAEVEALQHHGDAARVLIERAIAQTKDPGLKVIYRRDLAGTYALEKNYKSEFSELETAARDAEAQHDSVSASTLHAQMGQLEASNGHTAPAHAHLARAKELMGKGTPQGYYYTAMAHGLLGHWAQARDAIASAKAAPGADGVPIRNRIIAAEGFLATAQKRPADALTILAKADTTDVVVMDQLADAHEALGHKEDSANLRARIASNYALNLSDFGAANARARAWSAKPR